MKLSAEIVEAFERQAAACAEMSAPFTSRLCRILGSNLDASTGVGRRIRDWPRESLLAALVPLRVCAALNILVRRGAAPELGAFYPPNASDDEAGFWRAIEATLRAHDAEMTAFLDSPPQTNEVMRSAVLLGGFLRVGALTRMPLALHELGASAGLNLLFDHYAYDLGEGRRWGPANAPVTLASPWTGPAPSLDAPLSVAARAAVDLRPVDASNARDRERMLAYIWPEQFERIRRIEAALDLVSASGLRVEQGDALAWIRDRLSRPARSGVCRVIYHSVFMQYLPLELRDGLRAQIRALGESARADAPLAWLAMEAAPDRKGCELRLTLWPDGERRTLARVDWHGRWAEWI
jgi:hypothetical protein